jgi:hypothetical protein
MELELTNGYTATVDDKDPKKPWRFHWWAYEDKRKDGTVRTVYARRWEGNSRTNRKLIHLHRFLLGVKNPEVEVDHKDGNGLHNKRRNLRKSSHAQNQHNRGLQRNNTSGVKESVPREAGGRFR